MTEQTTAGAIRTILQQLETQIRGHMVPGGKLESLKYLFIGSREQAQIGSDKFPLALIIPKSGHFESYSTAGYLGQGILTMKFEIHVGALKLMEPDDNINAMANNALFDTAGNGPIPLFENVIYALLFSGAVASVDTFTPHLNLPLQKMVEHDFQFIDQGNFVYIVSDVTMDYKFAYPEISGS